MIYLTPIARTPNDSLRRKMKELTPELIKAQFEDIWNQIGENTILFEIESAISNTAVVYENIKLSATNCFKKAGKRWVHSGELAVDFDTLIENELELFELFEQERV